MNAVDTAGLGMTSDATPRTGDPWLTGPQMAKHLQISLRHLIRLRESGLPHVKLGTAIRYNVAEVEQYLSDRRNLPAHELRSGQHASPTARGGRNPSHRLSRQGAECSTSRELVADTSAAAPAETTPNP